MCSAVKSMVRFRLPKIIKFFFVLLMCLLIIISPCILRPVKVEAAMTGAAIVGGSVVVAGILSALGICCYFSNADNRQAFSDGCEQIYDDCKSGIDDVVARADIAAAGLASISVPTSTMKDVFNDAVQVIPQAGLTFSTVSDMLTKYQMSDFATTISSFAPVDFSNISKFASVQFLGRAARSTSIIYSSRILSSVPFCNIDGSTLGFTLNYSDADSRYWVKTASGKSAISTNFKVNWSNSKIADGTNIYINLLKVTLVSSAYYVLMIPSCLSDGTQYWASCSNPVGVAQGYSDGAVLPYQGQDVFSPSRDKFIADGTSAMNTPIDKVVNKLKEKVGDKDGNIPMTVPRGKSIDDDSEKQRQSDVIGKDISDTKDRNKDIATNKANDVPATKADDNTTAAENDDTLPPAIPKAQNPKKMKIPSNNLTTKFPFSIPWDLYHAISILKYPGEAPKFTLHFGSAAKVIDMSMFDPVATVARWGLSLLFLLSLIVLTGRVIKH